MSNGNEIAIPTPALPQNSHSQHKKSKNKGPYILGATLGEGAFAKVKAATQTQTKEKVAIKILNKSRLLEDENDILRIKKEIKILKKLRHKNIIQLYEVLESKKSLYIVMEFCEGGELFDYIVKKRKISELEACHLFQQIINGVEYLHEQNIIHRDLKPENLLLDHNMNIKISDFGLSTFFEYNNLLQTPCGTPSYAPPEMLKGDEYNGTSSDIWSCGIILYAMLCGSLPFSESKEDIICKKIMAHDYIIPGYVSKEAQDLLNHIMKINPKERFDIKMIKSHCWFNLTTPKLKPGLMIGKEKLPIDDVILNMVEKYGFEKEKCRKNLNEGIFDSITCVYYLCLKKYIAQGGKSVSDVDSELFEEYIFNQRYMKEKTPKDNASNSNSEIIENINEDCVVNDNEGNEYSCVSKKNSSNNLRYFQASQVDSSNKYPLEKITVKDNVYSMIETSPINSHANIYNDINNPNGQREGSSNKSNSNITSTNKVRKININNDNPLMLPGNNIKKCSSSTKSKSQNGKIRKISNEKTPILLSSSNQKGSNGKTPGNLIKITTQRYIPSNTNMTNLTTIANTNYNTTNSNNYPVYVLNKSKPKQLSTTKSRISNNHSQSKLNAQNTQVKKHSTKMTPLQSNSKDKYTPSIEIYSANKSKVKEFSSSVTISNQKDYDGLPSPSQINQAKQPINSNRHSFITSRKPQNQILSMQREQYKKNRNDAKENNTKSHHKSNPCPNDLFNLIDKEEDGSFMMENNEKHINIIEIISKRLVASSFCGSFQFPTGIKQQVPSYNKDDNSSLVQTLSLITNCNNNSNNDNNNDNDKDNDNNKDKDNDNNKDKDNDNIKDNDTSENKHISNVISNGGNNNDIQAPIIQSSVEKDKSIFFDVITIFNKSYKNRLTKDFKNDGNNQDIIDLNNEYATKNTINKTILSRINQKKTKQASTKEISLNSFNITSSNIKNNYNLIIPSVKKYKNESTSNNTKTDVRFDRSKIKPEDHPSAVIIPDYYNKQNNIKHYNKFLDISTNYDPGLDSRGESSIERSVSIKSEFRNFSISPERNKPSSVSKKRILTSNTLSSSFSGNKSTTSLKMVNNNIAVISEDEEFQFGEKRLNNAKREKNKYHNIEKKVTINLSMNMNDCSNSVKKKVKDTF